MKNKKLLAMMIAAAIAAAAIPAATAANDTAATEQAPPAMPDGQAPEGTPPAMPDGQAPEGTPPEKPDGEAQQGSAPQKSAASFSDVSDNDWFSEYVSFVASAGIMEGKNGRFSPNEIITRAEYITALYKAAGSPAVSGGSEFSDVADSAEYADAVAWAASRGIALGNGDGTFTPDTSLTREMAMTFLFRALDELNLTADTPASSVLDRFSDRAKISAWAEEGMNTLVNMGIIEGNEDGTVTPQGELTNAQVAAMIYRVLDGKLPQGGGQAPEGQSGERPEGTPPAMPDGSEGGQSGPGGAPGGQFGGSHEVTNGTAAATISEDAAVKGKSYTSTGDDENALRIDGAEVTLSGITVTKDGGSSSNTENGDFYGMNAGLLALNGAQVTITDSEFTTSATNGNAVFSYGEGTVVNISDSKIRTSANNSGGIQTTGGGTTNASNLDVETQGNSAAAIRSDRGGGTVNVDGGTYVTNGTGSPAIYSTADISVKNATLTANNSEAVVVEGKNSVSLENVDATGSMSGTYKDSSENIHNVMLYQSMSGDADVGTSSFSMKGGSLTAKAGDMFYVTNTQSVITLEDADLTLANGKLLTVEGNSSSRGWGTAGKNGAQVTFTAKDQKLEGEITVDTISTLDLTLSGSTEFDGTVNIVENAAGGEAVENNAVVTVEKGSTWTLTGDCTITSLENKGTINFNGHKITLASGEVLTK